MRRNEQNIIERQREILAHAFVETGLMFLNTRKPAPR